MKNLKSSLCLFAVISMLLFSRCGDDSPGCPFCHDELVADPVLPTSDPALTLEMKWCALDGPASIADPSLMCENNWRDMVMRKHMRAGQCIWVPQCKIIFGTLIGPNNQYGLLQDPDQTVGQPGDVVIDLNSNWSSELTSIANLAIAHWNDKQGGIYAVAIRRFIDANGNPVPIRGVATHDSGNRPILFLVDPEFLPSQFYDDHINTERVLAHEIGHALGLCHANGDNGVACNNGFLGFNVVNNLMSSAGANGSSKLLTASQCNLARTRFPQIFFDPNAGNRVAGFVADDLSSGRESTHWVSFDLDNDKTTGRPGKELESTNKGTGVDLMVHVVVGKDGIKKATFFQGKGEKFREVNLPLDILQVKSRTVEAFALGIDGCDSKPAFEEVEIEIDPKAFALLGLKE